MGVFHMVYSRTAVGHPMVFISQTTKGACLALTEQKPTTIDGDGKFWNVGFSPVAGGTRSELAATAQTWIKANRSRCRWVSKAVIVRRSKENTRCARYESIATRERAQRPRLGTIKVLPA